MGKEEAKSKKRPKIVGGEPATVKEFPFIVEFFRTTSKDFFCGGSIISEKYALTAAHCTFGYFPKDVTLRVGSANWTNGGVEHTVRRLINHEDHVYSINDIALMEFCQEKQNKVNAVGMRYLRNVRGKTRMNRVSDEWVLKECGLKGNTIGYQHL
ncbi:unnamed protein product [Timema podura]|uniref:Peptidase S1 domain-containing protein n=1 Tax=Timema podura TaxID=61482 RepID=A0ABN7NZ76_TIMPD|nr:unnamed protein product [Timema podura]